MLSIVWFSVWRTRGFFSLPLVVFLLEDFGASFVGFSPKPLYLGSGFEFKEFPPCSH